jgi:hypothetical protein
VLIHLQLFCSFWEVTRFYESFCIETYCAYKFNLPGMHTVIYRILYIHDDGRMTTETCTSLVITSAWCRREWLKEATILEHDHSIAQTRTKINIILLLVWTSRLETIGKRITWCVGKSPAILCRKTRIDCENLSCCLPDLFWMRSSSRSTTRYSEIYSIRLEKCNSNALL